MPNAINYAKQYAQALSQSYPNVLHFGALFSRNQEGDYRFTNSNTVEVPTISVTGRTDGDRDTIGAKQRRHTNKWTPLTLRNHRKWDDLIHPRDIVETNQVLSIQNITRVFNQEQKFPEKDKYLVSTLYNDWCLTGRVPFSIKLTSENVLEVFDLMMEQMTEKNVPASGRILYCTTKVDTLLKNAKNFYRNIDVTTQSASIQRAVSAIDQVKIEIVPSDHMLTAYDFSVGAVKGASAKQIQMFLVHPSCVITPEVYDFAQLDAPSAGSDGKYVYFEESFEDVFILPNKQYGIDFVVAGIESETATFVTVASTEGDAISGDAKITITAPIGSNLKNGSRYFFATGAEAVALGYGKVAVDDENYEEIIVENGSAIINGANGGNLVVLVTDIDGRVYASGTGKITSKA